MRESDISKTTGNCVYKDILRPKQALRRAYEGLSTADVAGLPADQTSLGTEIHPLWNGVNAFGPALTVCNASNDTLMLHYAVEICQAGDILMITAEEPSESALWGKMLTIVAQARGVAGVIVDGPVRDTHYIRESKFPVWSRSISPLGSQRKGPGSINIPLNIGGVLVNPGDLVLADDDGILIIPINEANKALAGAEERLQKERAAMPQLKKGFSPYHIWGMEKALRESGVKTFPTHFSDHGPQNR